MPRYSAQDIANYFLFRAQQDDQELLSNLKLQKLVYYAQGLHLAMFGKAIFKDKIEAWEYGPVIPTLYHTYKRFGAGSIPSDPEFDPTVIDKKTLGLLDQVYEVFGQFSAIRLMEIAHTDKCWKDVDSGAEITHSSMKACLTKYIKKKNG